MAQPIKGRQPAWEFPGLITRGHQKILLAHICGVPRSESNYVLASWSVAWMAKQMHNQVNEEFKLLEEGF